MLSFSSVKPPDEIFSKRLEFSRFVACDGRDFRRSRKASGGRNFSSSWEASADNYFSKSSDKDNSDVWKNRLREFRKSKSPAEGRRFEKRLIETEDVGAVENSRWDRNRSNKNDWTRDREAGVQVSRTRKIPAEERRFEKQLSGDEDLEPVDDSRWDRIRSDYDRIMDREARYERPEVARWNRQENWGRNAWKQATESSIPKIVGESVYGVNPILAALTSGRREFYALYLQDGMDLSEKNKKKKDKKSIKNILKIADEIGLTVKEASKHDLNMISDNRPHQGLILDASPLEMVGIRELDHVSVKGGDRAPVWIALDEIMDPQNLGAIIRSAYFFGVEGVILCAKNSAPLSGVVSKASAGSLEMIELRSCKNMMQFLSSSADNGWRILGGSVSPKALPLGEVRGEIPTVIVLGSEGTGLRPLVERSCTDLVRIPGVPLVNDDDDHYQDGDDNDNDDGEDGKVYTGDHRPFVAVESLNVSVAAGVLLYHLTGNTNQKLLGS